MVTKKSPNNSNKSPAFLGKHSPYKTPKSPSLPQPPPTASSSTKDSDGIKPPFKTGQATPIPAIPPPAVTVSKYHERDREQSSYNIGGGKSDDEKDEDDDELSFDDKEMDGRRDTPLASSSTAALSRRRKKTSKHHLSISTSLSGKSLPSSTFSPQSLSIPQPSSSNNTNSTTTNTTSDITTTDLKHYSKKNLHTMVEFYKSMCITHEEHVQSLSQQLEDQTPLHKSTPLGELEILVGVKAQEITRLNDYATLVGVSVLEEKERTLNLQGEVERLKIVEMELKHEINRRDNAVNNRCSGAEEVTFYRDCRPETLRKNTITNESSPGGRTMSSPSTSRRGVTSLASPATSIRGRLGGDINVTNTNDDGEYHSSSSRNKGGSSSPHFSSPPSSRVDHHLGGSSNRSTSTPTFRSPSNSTPSTKSTTSPHKSPHHNGSSNQNQSQQPRQILRTVYLPNEHADALVLMVESLSTQLSSHKSLNIERQAALEEGYAVREREHKSRLVEQQTVIKQLGDRCHDVELKWRSANNDLNQQTQTLNLNERQHAEDNLHKMAQYDSLEADHLKLQTEIQKLKGTVRTHSEVSHRNLLNQIQERQDDIIGLHTEYKELQTQYDSKIEDLNDKLRGMKGKFKALEERRYVEIKAFQRDIGGLKNNIRELELHDSERKKEEMHRDLNKHDNNHPHHGRRGHSKRHLTSRSILEHSPSGEEAHGIAGAESDKFYGAGQDGVESELNTEVARLKNRVSNLTVKSSSEEEEARFMEGKMMRVKE
jgi:hypothetical protein